jgi:hypothetical protein
MADIPSALKKIQIEGARAYSAGSEALIQAVGATCNAIVDKFTNIAAKRPLAVSTFTQARTGYGTNPDTYSYSTGANQVAVVNVFSRNGDPGDFVSITVNGKGITMGAPFYSFMIGASQSFTVVSLSGRGSDIYIQLLSGIDVTA